jgi:DNA invertase Pin-like site-specific DNA recombinase
MGVTGELLRWLTLVEPGLGYRIEIKLTRRQYDSIRGSNNFNSKLTNTQVLEIRRLLKKGLGQIEIARMFGVSKQTISGIKTGDRWNWLKGGEGAQ